MKLALIFPPVFTPTAPPLGISCLKSYIEKNTNTEIKNIDLNLTYHDRIVDSFLNENFYLYKDRDKNNNAKKLIEKSVEIFKKDGKDFFDSHQYNLCVNEFIYLIEKVSNLNEISLLKFIKNSDERVRESSQFYIESIKNEKPDMVGFSIITKEQISHSLAFAKIIKEELDIPVVVGGSIVSLHPKRYLRYYSDYVDYVVCGDGETALSKLSTEEKTDKIPSLVYLNEKKIIANREENIDIDEMPAPDFSDFKLQGYYSPKLALPVLSSRGCYWRRCAFCSDCDSVAMIYRARKIHDFIEELKYLKRSYKTDYFFFEDEMISPKRFKEISQGLIKAELNIFYSSQAKPTVDFNRDTLKKMHQSGCRVILWGIESACQRILNLIDKGTKVEDMELVLKNSNMAGIRNATYAFGGFPTETEEEYKQTLDFLDRNRAYIDLQFMGLFRLCKGSLVFKHPERYGITKIHEDPKNILAPNYNYEIEEGISQKRCQELFFKNYSFFLNLSKFSPWFGKFRDHMLIYYSKNENKI